MECDAVDAVILRFIIDFFNSGSMRIIVEDDGNSVYFWVHYDTILREVPIIGIKKQALRDRMDRFVTEGLMEKKVVKDKTGTYTYFRFIKEVYETLIRSAESSTGSGLPAPTGSGIPVRTGSGLPPKDSSTTIHSSTKEILILFKAWSERPELFKHKPESAIKNIRKKHEEIVRDIGIDQSVKAVNNYADILKSKDHYFSYKWTFWDFIARGIYKFIDDADPFNGLSSKKQQPVDDEKQKFLKELG